MADNADIADGLIENSLERSLALLRSARPRGRTEVCVGCEEPIPADRQAALSGMGCLRCLDCQQVHDQLTRMGRRAHG